MPWKVAAAIAAAGGRGAQDLLRDGNSGQGAGLVSGRKGSHCCGRRGLGDGEALSYPESNYSAPLKRSYDGGFKK